MRQLTAGDVPALLSAVRESMDAVGAWMPWCHPDCSAVDAAVYSLLPGDIGV